MEKLVISVSVAEYMNKEIFNIYLVVCDIFYIHCNDMERIVIKYFSFWRKFCQNITASFL